MGFIIVLLVNCPSAKDRMGFGFSGSPNSLAAQIYVFQIYRAILF